MRVEQNAAAACRVRGERSLSGRAIAEASVLDHDGLRALKQVARDPIGHVLPPDREEGARTSAAVERHSRDGVVLIATADDNDKRRVRRPPDRARAAHRELAVRGRLAHGDLLDEITALEAREVAGEVRIVEEGEPIESEPVERCAESTLTKWRGVDGGVRPSEPVRVEASLRV